MFSASSGQRDHRHDPLSGMAGVESLGSAGNQPQHRVHHQLRREPWSAHQLLQRVAECVSTLMACMRELCRLRLAAYNYSTVTQYKQGAVSNYNGLTFSLRKQFSNWISGHLNYTWSHNIDETSNGGLFQYGFEGNNTILGQITPTNLRTSNYGNSDYDIRHLVNADFVVNPEFHKTGAIEISDRRLAVLGQDVLAYWIAVHNF